MKNLKLLNKKYLSIIVLFITFGLSSQSQEPIDIWDVEKKTVEESRVENSNKENIPKNTIYEMQSQKDVEQNIEEGKALISKEIKILGLYDPAENGLSINMWSN